MLSIVGGPVDTTDAQTLVLPEDDKGTLPFKLQRLLALDADSQDFVFQQGMVKHFEGSPYFIFMPPSKKWGILLFTCQSVRQSVHESIDTHCSINK